jgi:ABC-type bacteriocin/lantibiotic exporter with double-glycine peptidase domain
MADYEVKAPLKRLFKLLQNDRREIIRVYIYALLNGLVNLSLPLGIQAIINLIQGAEVSTAWIVLVGFVLIGIALSGALQLFQLRLVENIAQRVFSRASFEFAYRIPKIRYRELYNYYAPELANRFFDTITVQKGLPKILIDFSLASFQIVAGLVVLGLYHPFFILFGVLLIALVYTILAFSGPRGVRTSLKESSYKYKVAHWLEEIARTRLSFKLIGEPDLSLQKVNTRVTKYLNARENHFRVLISQFMQLIGFKFICAAGLLITGGLLVFRQEMNIGQFVAAEIIILLIISSVEKLIASLESIYDVITALEKIGTVTDMELENDEGMTFDEDITGLDMTLQNVSFHFPESERMIIKDLNLHIPADESVVITGPAGSGKSTLMQIFSGIIEPTDGVIKFNNLSVQSLDFLALRQHIGYSLSNNQIFLGCLYDNIVMGRQDISTKDVTAAIQMVNLGDFVGSLRDGLYTDLDPEGKRIPRSATNKILLARAIVTQPKLLVLEDPLDHVPHDEKEMIIQRMTDPKNPWNIVVTTVDETWRKYITTSIFLKNGSTAGPDTSIS